GKFQLIRTKRVSFGYFLLSCSCRSYAYEPDQTREVEDHWL
ncbi:unnamed protein product, partial [Musa acuminata var. zebrina]